MRVSTGPFFYLATILLLLLSPPSGSTKTLHVNSSSQLKSALTQAQAGDEILVASGTYIGRFSIAMNSGTATNAIVLRAEQRHKAIIQGNGDMFDAKNQGLIVRRSYWVIDG